MSLSAPDGSPQDPGFAPQDIADARPPFEWASKWPATAISKMRYEALYLLLCLAFGLFVLAKQFYPQAPGAAPLSLLSFGLLAWSAGLIGGTAFGLKWFYHVIAKGLWHMDRRYWRLFCPIISSVLAFFTNLVLYKDNLTENSQSGISVALKLLTTGFLAGYFSDNAFAKLAEVAKVLFGTAEKSGTRPPT
jgi:hypothetical protein